MKITFCFSVFLILSLTSTAQNAADDNKEMTKTVMSIWKDSVSNGNGKSARWNYDQGVILKGIEGLWKFTGDGDYFDSMQKGMDFFVGADGQIRT